MFLNLIIVFGIAVTSPAGKTLPETGCGPILLSSTALLETTLFRHFRESRGCWNVKKSPPIRTLRAEAAGILEGCERAWPGDPQVPYRLLALMLTEGQGFTRASTPPERTYGPCCVSIEETRITARVWGLPCPRSRTAIVRKHEEDARWSLVIAAGTVWRYEQAAGGDRMRAILIYKYGATGLSRALEKLSPPRGPSELKEWRRYAAYVAWVECLRSRIVTGTPPPDCMCWPVVE